LGIPSLLLTSSCVRPFIYTAACSQEHWTDFIFNSTHCVQLRMKVWMFHLQLRSITRSIEITPSVKCLLLTCISIWMHRWMCCVSVLINATRWHLLIASLTDLFTCDWCLLS